MSATDTPKLICDAIAAFLPTQPYSGLAVTPSDIRSVRWQVEDVSELLDRLLVEVSPGVITYDFGARNTSTRIYVAQLSVRYVLAGEDPAKEDELAKLVEDILDNLEFEPQANLAWHGMELVAPLMPEEMQTMHMYSARLQSRYWNFRQQAKPVAAGSVGGAAVSRATMRGGGP